MMRPITKFVSIEKTGEIWRPLAALCGVVCLPFVASAATPGEIDPAFDPALGAGAEVNVVIPLDDGKVLAGGWFSLRDTPGQFAVARLNSDGSLDATFAPVRSDAAVLAMLTDQTGRVIVGGSFSQLGGVSRRFIGRLNTNGETDTNFEARAVTKQVTSMNWQGNRILVACKGVARLDASGVAEPTTPVWKADWGLVRVQPDLKYIKISTPLPFPGEHAGIERDFEDGKSSDRSFQRANPNGRANALEFQPDGRILLGGEFTKVFDVTPASRLSRLERNGVFDPSFDPGPGPDGAVLSLGLQRDGNVLIGGSFSQVSGLPRSGVARLSADGAVDDFDARAETNSVVRSIAIQKDGAILIAGRFETVQGLVRPGIARVSSAGEASPPTIVRQPEDQFAFEGGNASFRVQAAASQAEFQWQFKGRDLPGATNGVLSLSNVQLSQSGDYQAVVRTSAGTITSQSAALTVVPLQPLTKWTLRHEFPVRPAPNYGTLSHVTFGNGMFVAVGGGAMLTSQDGETWTQQPSEVARLAVDVAFGNNQFVAVGGAGTVLISTNGANWATNTVSGSPWLTSIHFLNGGFVALSGSPTTVHFSADGAEWRSSKVNAGLLNSVAYGNDKYVAVGTTASFGGTFVAATSPDGIIWTTHFIGTSGDLREVIFVKDRFYAVASSGAIGSSPVGVRIVSSLDGEKWTPILSGTSEEFYGIVHADNTFMAVGGSRGGPGTFIPAHSVVLSSPDGSSWKTNLPAGTTALQDVAYGNGRFVAIGYQNNSGPGVTGEIVISSDGRQWRFPGTPFHLRAVAFGEDSFAAVGDSGTILASPDGVDWTKRVNVSGAYLKDVCFAQGTYVAVGQGGTILSSTNGLDWVERASGTALDLGGVTFASGEFYVVGGFRIVLDSLNPNPGDPMELVILRSRDGEEWSLVESRRDWGSLVDVAYGDGMFLAVGAMQFDFGLNGGEKANMAGSTNGLNWSRFLPGVVGGSYDLVEYGNGRFVTRGGAVGVNLGILTNRFDIVGGWANRSSSLSAFGTVVSGLSFGRNTFLALGRGAVSASTDGLDWRLTQTGNPAALYDAAFGRDTFVAVGANGVILQSDTVPDGATLRLTDAVWRDGAFHVSFRSDAGRDYVLEFKNALEEPSWREASTRTGDGSIVQLSDASAPSQQRFYRVRIR